MVSFIRLLGSKYGFFYQIMTVEPGFGGQSFMENMMGKVTIIFRDYKVLYA